MKKQDRGQKGVAAVEFALVLPVLVLLAFGIIEFSIALYDKAVITNASREGARAGIVFSDPPVSDGEIIEVVNNYCRNKLITFGTTNQLETNIIREGTSTGDDLTVRVRYDYQFLLVPTFVTSLTGGIQLTAETVMRME